MTTHGPSNYRAYALRERGQACEVCGWRKRPDTLEVHHVDGNRNDNRLANLQVLCARCHAITEADTRKWKRKERYIQWLAWVSP